MDELRSAVNVLVSDLTATDETIQDLKKSKDEEESSRQNAEAELGTIREEAKAHF